MWAIIIIMHTMGRESTKSWMLDFLAASMQSFDGDFPRVVAVLDVLCDGHVKEAGFLGYKAHLGALPASVEQRGIVGVKHLERVQASEGKEHCQWCGDGSISSDSAVVAIYINCHFKHYDWKWH